MKISDVIAGFIQEALENEEGCAELQRSELASRFHCVPSQINYVITTRFSPEQGYMVESRRGGGGYIRIRRVCQAPRQLVMHIVNAVGEQIDAHAARIFIANLLDREAMDAETAELMAAAVSDNALRCLPQPHRDMARAGILKQMLTQLLCKGVD